MKIYYVHTNQILGFDITDLRLEIRFMKAYGSKFSMSEILFLSVFHIMFLDSQNRFLETRKKLFWAALLLHHSLYDINLAHRALFTTY